MNVQTKRNSQAGLTRFNVSFRLTVAAALVGSCGMIPTVSGQSGASSEGGCFLSSPPVQDEFEGGTLTMNRAIAFSVGDLGKRQAIRITIDSVTEQHLDYLIGSTWWVQPKNGLDLSGPVSKRYYSELSCVPHFADWHGVCTNGQCESGLRDSSCASTRCIGGPNHRDACNNDAQCPGDPCSQDADCAGGILSVIGVQIVPGASYTVSVVEENCDLGDPASYASGSRTLTTSKYGDVMGIWTPNGYSAPDGAANLSDVLAVLGAFSALAFSRNLRMDLEPSRLDLFFNISDTLEAIRAFSGSPFRFHTCFSASSGVCAGGPYYDGDPPNPCSTDLDCRIQLCP